MKSRDVIPIYKPSLTSYKKSALEAIESEWISNHGKNVELATLRLQNILNVNHVILMCNGTVATHCLLIALKFKYPNIKNIYIPNNVYIAAYNTVLMEYSISNIEILKIDNNTWNFCLDEEYILSLKKDSCIFVVHNLGNIIDVEKIHNLRPDIILVEDNCEGIFGKYNGIYSGTSQKVLCSSLSFYGNKTITTGEGGAFLTQDKEVYKYIKKVYSQGMSSIKYVHDVHAYNYRMTNIQAGFLLDQLEDLYCILEKKQKVFERYNKLFENLITKNKIKLQLIDPNTERSNWIYSIRILNNKFTTSETNDFFYTNLIEIRPFFYPFREHEHIQKIKFDDQQNLDISNKLNKEIIMIPSSPSLSLEEQQYIVGIVNKFIDYNDINFIFIDETNVHILKSFLQNKLSSYFRYFKNRDIESIKFHVITLILEYDNNYIAYAHIDKKDGKNWIGICILDEYQSKGFGKMIMEKIIQIAKNKNIQQLHLSVDLKNNIAISLYNKCGFMIENQLNDKIYMVNNLF
jgi:perosamine synthetase